MSDPGPPVLNDALLVERLHMNRTPVSEIPEHCLRCGGDFDVEDTGGDYPGSTQMYVALVCYACGYQMEVHSAGLIAEWTDIRRGELKTTTPYTPETEPVALDRDNAITVEEI